MSTIQKTANSLLDRGWFIKLSMSPWENGKRLGFPISVKGNPELSAFMKLIPQLHKRVCSIQNDTRELVKLHTSRTFFGNYISGKSYPLWLDEYSKLISEFELLRSDAVLNYDDLNSKFLLAGREIAKAEWNKSYPNSGNPTEPFFREWDERLVKSLPSKEWLYNTKVYELLEYRPRKSFTPVECEKFLYEVSSGFYNRVKKLVDAVIAEDKLSNGLRIQVKSHLAWRAKHISSSWMFLNPDGAVVFDELNKAFVSGDDKWIVDAVKNVMVFVVPRFAEDKLIGITEGIENL